MNIKSAKLCHFKGTQIIFSLWEITWCFKAPSRWSLCVKDSSAISLTCSRLNHNVTTGWCVIFGSRAFVWQLFSAWWEHLLKSTLRYILPKLHLTVTLWLAETKPYCPFSEDEFRINCLDCGSDQQIKGNINIHWNSDQ